MTTFIVFIVLSLAMYLQIRVDRKENKPTPPAFQHEPYAEHIGIDALPDVSNTQDTHIESVVYHYPRTTHIVARTREQKKEVILLPSLKQVDRNEVRKWIASCKEVDSFIEKQKKRKEVS